MSVESEDYKQQLGTILKNLKKSVNRDFSAGYIKKKREQVLNLVDKLESENVDNIVSEINVILKQKQGEIEDTVVIGNNESKEQQNDGKLGEAENNNSTQETVSKGSTNNIVFKNKMSGISFRDVEEALEKFSGTSDAKEWLEAFEAVGDSCEWNEVQKYLFMRRLLTGAAKLAVEASREVRTYKELQVFLEEEFHREVSGAEIHEAMKKRRKGRSETYMEYLYTMQRLASKSKLDDRSLIKYIVNGIEENPGVKFSLLQSKDLSELKRKLVVCEDTSGRSKSTVDAEWVKSKKCFKCNEMGHLSSGCKKSTEIKCYKCGENGHKANACYKPATCFKCNKEGHIARDCNVKKVNNISVDNLPEMHVLAIVEGKQMIALFDTGCDVNLIKETAYNSLENKPQRNNKIFPLTSFGKNVHYTKGTIFGRIQVNDYVKLTNISIVPDHMMSTDLIVGKDYMGDVMVTIQNGNIQLYRDVEEEEQPFKAMNVKALVQKEVTDLSHVENKKLANEVLQLVQQYKPEQPAESSVKLSIMMKDDIPVHQAPRRLAPREATTVAKQIEEWLEEKIIQPSVSPYASPIVVVKKKDGSNRLCVDYRKLNDKIIKDRYPLPIIEDVLENFHDANVFTTLDLKNGFFHVDVDKESQRYTAFVTPNGHYEFLKVPFGLCNSPAVFQRYINQTFWPLIKEKVVVVYMDDLIIPARDEQENVNKVRRVLELAQKNGLIIRFDKCQFVRRRVTYLGHILERGTVQPSTEKIKAIQKYPEPKDVKQIQSFLGLAGYFRKFVQNFAAVAKPLTDLTKKGVLFKFNNNEKFAFQTLKEALCDKPVLQIFNPYRPSELHTDASAVGFGACLLQKGDDTAWHPVFYLSSKTTEAEARYSSYELEVLAIVRALKKLRVYLLGLKFEIYTDCQAFNLTMKKKSICARVARWALQLEEFDCEVKHRSGTSMRHVDALSRFPAVFLAEEGILERMRKSQAEDATCSAIREVLKNNSYKNYLMKREILYKVVDGCFLLVVPKSMQNYIIKTMHEKGHICAAKVESLVKQEYDIVDLKRKVARVLANCVPCILSSRKAGKQEGYYNPIEKLAIPLHTYHIDHLGPMPSTAKKYQYLFVVVDAFTKYMWIYPVKTVTASETIKKLEELKIMCGNPHRIVSDRGAAFTSGEFRKFCEEENIVHVLTTTGVPRGNGQVERANGIIVPVLTKLSIENPMQWYRHVSKLQRIINSTTSRSTKQTPFKLLFGVDMRNSEDVQLAKLIEEGLQAEFNCQRQELRMEAKKNIDAIQEENRHTFNKKRKDARKYEIDDWVAIKKTQFQTGGKVQADFMGPYKIAKVLKNDRYVVHKVKDGPGPSFTSTAVDFMKPWADESDESSGSED